MPKAASDKQKEKEKQPEEIMAPLDQRLDTIIKMIMDVKEDNKKEHEKGQEKFGKDIKSLRDDMKVRDEKLAQAEGEIVHLGNKTRDLEKDYLSLDRRIQEQEAAIVSQAATIESQNLKMQDLERKMETSGTGCDKLYRLLGDIDRRQQQLERQISPSDLQKSSCYLFLHNLAMPAGVTLKDLLERSDPATPKIIRDSLLLALGESCAKFITKRDPSGRFSNIAEIHPCPDQTNYKHPRGVPEHCRNSLLLRCANRLQTVTLEAEIRRSLISTSEKRRNSELAFLETGIYSPSHKIRSLHRLLLWRGRVCVDNLDQMFDQYRCTYRGGLRTNQPGAIFLTMELRASKRLTDEARPDIFYDQNGASTRNHWTDFRNVHWAEPETSWFPPRASTVARVISKISRPTVDSGAREEWTITCQEPSCDQTFRTQNALDAHVKNDHSNQNASETNRPANEDPESIHQLSDSEAEDNEETPDQQVIDIVNEDETQEAAEADQTTFSPASELNRRAKRVSKKRDNPEPAQPSVSAPSSNKKPVKAVSKKTPANSTPSLRQQKLNFAGSNTPVPSASFNLLNQI